MPQKNIRLDEAMNDLLNKAVANASAAAGKNVPVSQWIRDAITEKAEREEQRASK